MRAMSIGNERRRSWIPERSDDLIAGVLNRNGTTTGHGNRWTRERVTALRSHHKIPLYRLQPDGIEPWLKLEQGGEASRRRAQRRSAWPPNKARLTPCIRCQTGRGSLAAHRVASRRPNASRIALAKTQNTPRDRIPINKTSSLQPHRQVGIGNAGL